MFKLRSSVLTIRNPVQMIAAAFFVTTLAVCATVIHLHLNYDQEMRDTVQGKAVIATIVVCFPLTLIVMWQMLKTHRLSVELQRLVNRDRLTDAATRDFFFEKLAASPDGYGVSLMIDIDHFKQVNDTYGHLAGDDVIRQVATILRLNVRPDDIVCRFGGEEFVVFLKDAGPDEGWAISERIRQDIEGAVTPFEDGVIKVTVSVGGSLKKRIESIDEAIARADACLYRAKEFGRNRTEVDWERKDKARAE